MINTQTARSILALSVAIVSPGIAGAQSLLDRPPNMSGDWSGAPGTLYFHFVHRFAASDAPERKVSNVPTFLVAAGLPMRILAGFNYSTNSTLAPRFPNEWELFARWTPFSEDLGAPVEVGAQAGYNNAADGVDGEVSIAKRLGPMRAILAARALSNPFDSGDSRFAVASGATFRLNQYFALAGDIASLADRDSTERVAWSAGLHFAIPLTPHTVSLHATNSMLTTLQGASRGSSDIRYGFEFTIPLTLRRYFGRRAEPPSAAQDTAAVVAAQPATKPAATAQAPKVVRTSIKNVNYVQSRLQVTVGTTIVWTNNDPMPHTVTATDKTFDSGLINPGKTFRYTFTKAGTFNFVCTPHPFMQGIIVVRNP